MKNSSPYFAVCLLCPLVGLAGTFQVHAQPGSQEIRSQIDREPKPNQLAYSPEDGSTVNLNPPPFVWVPVEPIRGKFVYILQISKDKGFQTRVISRRGIDISTHALDEPLEAGEWYWRYGVEGGAGEWFWRYGLERGVNASDTYPTLSPGHIFFSRVRKFTVTPDAKTRSLPGVKFVIGSIPRSRPRLFILEDEIGSYRHRARYGDLKDLTSEIVKICEEHLGEALIAEPPSNKAILEFLKVPIVDVGAKYGDETCPFTRYAINIMEKFGVAYLLTGDERYGEEAKKRVLHFYSWDPRGERPYDEIHEAALWRLYKGLSTYDWTYDLFTAGEREKVEKVMRERLQAFYEYLKYRSAYHSFNYQSHAARICGFLGEGAVCFAHEWPEAEDWLKYALTVYWNLHPTWGKDDGAWHEGPGYYNLYMTVGLHFLTALRKATGIDLTEKEFYKNTPYYVLYTNPPYARMSPFGDLQHLPPSNTSPTYELVNRGELMYQLSTLMNNPYARWYAEQTGSGPGKNILGVLLKDDRVEPKNPSDLPQARYFPGVGLVSLHTALGDADKDIHFLFHSDPYGGVSRTHFRPDHNAFTLEAFGEALAIASGYYPWWDSEHVRKWGRTTKGANSITINGGKGQPWGDPAATGEIAKFESNEMYDCALGDASRSYKGLLTKFHRHVVHLKPGVFILFDDLEAPEPANFEWWLHALSEMRIDGDDKRVIVSQGDARLKVQFLQPGGLSFNQLRGFPDAPPEHGEPDQWHVVASTTLKSRRSRFITLLIPFRNGREPTVTVANVVDRPDDVSLRLTREGKEYRVMLFPKVTVSSSETPGAGAIPRRRRADLRTSR